MATWRYTARFFTPSVENAAIDVDLTRPYPAVIEAEAQGVDTLAKFLDICKYEFGSKLRWVTLERSAAHASYFESGDWEGVKRLEP